MFVCSAALAHVILKERLHFLGIVGCVLCIVGSTTIVLHAPKERTIESVKDVWLLATEPGECIIVVSMYVSAQNCLTSMMRRIPHLMNQIHPEIRCS